MSMQQRGDDDSKVSAQDRLARYYYNGTFAPLSKLLRQLIRHVESFFTNWLTVGLAILTVGTILKLNVHTAIGATVFLAGVLVLTWTMAMSFVWLAMGENNVQATIRIRRWSLVVMQLLLLGTLGVLIGALCLLYIQKGDVVL